MSALLENRDEVDFVPGSTGFTCIMEGKYFPTLRGALQHDERSHGGSRVTLLPGRWERRP